MDEETKKKKLSNKKRLIIIISVGAGLILIFLIASLFLKKNRELKHAHEDKEEIVYKDVVREKKTIEKLYTFVNAAMYNDFGYEGLARTFTKGVDKLNKEQKLKLVFQYLTSITYENEKIDKNNIPERYKNDETIGNFKNAMSMLSSRTLEKEYQKIFNEEPKYDEETLKKLKTCPSVYKLDTRVKKIFLFNECNLKGDSIILTKIFNYKFDEDYYYVYQYVGLMKEAKDEKDKRTYWRIKDNKKVDVEDFYGHETSFETVIWKFDKNYNFISTSNNG